MKVFHNPYKGQPQVWSAQSASVKIVGSGDELATILGALEGVTVSYQRQFNTRYPIGGQKPIKMAGVPAGTIQLQTIVGPTANIETFLKHFGSACKTFTVQLNTNSNAATMEGCEQMAKAQKLTCKGCSGSQITYSLASNGGMSIASGMFVIEFTDLDWKG